MEFGFLSVIPTLLVLLIAILSKKEIEPLVIGCLLGSVLIGGTGFLDVLIGAGYTAMSDPGFMMVAIVSFGFAGLIGLMNTTGGAERFAQRSAKLIRGQRSCGVVTWLLCWGLFVDDYMHAMVATATMKKIADRFHLPRRVLAYIASATAGAMVVLIPTTVWSGFFIGIFDNEFLAPLGFSGYELYMRTIPFILYSFISIAMALLVAVKVLPTVKAMRSEDDIVEDDVDVAEKYGFEPKAIYFVLPLLVTVVVAVLLGGHIVAGLYVGIFVACAMYMVKRIMKWEQIRTAFLDGAKTLLPTVIMLFFTFTLVQINAQLGFTEYVVEAAKPFMSANLLPAIIFIIASVICFSTGSYWGTSALITPIASALAISSGAHVFLTLGAIVSGAVFGSSSCLFGDCTILSATGAGVKPMSHALAQLPYCIAGWLICVASFLVLGFVL